MSNLDLNKLKIHQLIGILTKTTLLIGIFLAIYQGRYQVATETTIIFFLTFTPTLLGIRFNIRVPHEFDLLAIVFIYATLFLGEVHDYYLRFWWWDLVLHASAGLLLGILGFLMVYIMNKNDKINLELTPGFMALFAFVFAIAFGVIWEIFEFSMDQLFGLNMQKPMFNDSSGLTDTMWDLIVNTASALLISILGYGYFRTVDRDSFLEDWIDGFIDKNPRLFRMKNRKE
jgi:hypothetical protein